MKHIKTHAKYQKDPEKKIITLRKLAKDKYQREINDIKNAPPLDNQLSRLIGRVEEQARLSFVHSFEVYKETQADSDLDYALTMLRLSKNATDAKAKAYMASPNPVEVEVSEFAGPLQYKTFIPLRRWLESLTQALSFRDHDMVALLLQHTSEKAIVDKDDSSKIFTRLKVDYIKGMLDDTAPHERLWRNFVNAFPRRDAIDAFYVDPYMPYFYIAIGDEKGFEQAMITATQTHKKMAQRANSVIHFSIADYPPELLGAASLAFDKHGWTLKHKNDYLPPMWIYNQWQL